MKDQQIAHYEGQRSPYAMGISEAVNTFKMSRSHIYRLSKRGLIDLKLEGRKTLLITSTMIKYLNSLPSKDAYSFANEN